MKQDEMGEHVALMGEMIWKPEGQSPHGRPGHRWECNFRSDVWEILLEGVGWKHVAHDTDQWRALVNTVLKLRIP